MLFADFVSDGIAFYFLMFGLTMIITKRFLSKVDVKGEISVAAKKKAVSTVLRWFK